MKPAQSYGEGARPNGRSLGNLIDYWLTSREIVDPQAVKTGLRDIRDKHFDTVHFFPVSVHDHSDPVLVKAVGKAVTHAHSLGLKSVLHLRTYHDRAFLARHPEAVCRRVREYHVPAGEASFEVRVRYSGNAFRRIVRAVEVPKDDERMERLKNLKVAKLGFEIESSIAVRRTGFLDRYKEVVIKGAKTPGSRLLLYVEFDTDHIDLAHPRMRDYITEVLGLYRGMEVDGFSWDEPGHPWPGGQGFEGHTLTVSEGIEKAFRGLTGHDLEDALPFLIQRSESPKLPSWRIAYYTALRDSLYDAQMHFKKEAQRLLGKETEIGIHHTWQETESGDLLAGNIDYPHLNDCVTSGYTDGVYFFGEVSTVYVSCLASSLANRSDTKEAYCNLWCFRPREWSVEYHTRLLGLFHVNWFAIGYGDSSAVCFPHHHTWPSHGTYAKRLQEFNGALAGARRLTTIGMVHTWQALAVDRSKYCVAHRAGMMRYVLHASRLNHGVYVLGIDALAEAQIKGRKLAVDGYELELLVVPWPFFLEKAAWAKVEKFIEAGGKCILYGQVPPADCSGDPCFKFLQSSLGAACLSPDEHRFIEYEKSEITGHGPLDSLELRIAEEEREDKVAIRIRERTQQDHIRLQYTPLRTTKGDPLLSHGEHTLGVKLPKRDAYYFSFEFPMYGRAAATLTAALGGVSFPELSRTCYIQQYAKGGETILAICAKTPEGSVQGEYPLGEETVTLPEGKMAIVRLAGRKVKDVKTW